MCQYGLTKGDVPPAEIYEFAAVQVLKQEKKLKLEKKKKLHESLKKREEKKAFLQALKENLEKEAQSTTDKPKKTKINDPKEFDVRKIRLPVEKQSLIYDNVEKAWQYRFKDSSQQPPNQMVLASDAKKILQEMSEE